MPRASKSFRTNGIRFLFVLAGAALPAHAALAQDAPYLDDRSSAASLVKSLYNAVSRKEYGRAWSYFDEEKPAKTFDDYVQGFKNTTKVEVHVGQTSIEGTAGSIYYNIPVAIEASGADQAPKVFAGCYTARLSDPQVQGEAFRPMHLLKGSLAPSGKPLSEAAPARCGDGEPNGDDMVLAQAKAAFAAANASGCDSAGTAPERDIQDRTIKYKAESDAAGDPERTARLIAFPCLAGAYNFSTVYYLWDELGGLRQLSFATPTLDIEYAEPDNTESRVKSVTVVGFSADDQLVNSEFDEATQTLTSWNKWRGVGDASSNGTWRFKDGQFVLMKYDVDASYDGEVDPQTVIDYGKKP